MLAEPGDGEVLSQYAKLIWELHHDRERASGYFEQAVQAAPQDRYAPPPPLPLPSPPFCTSIIPGWWVADPAPPPLSGSHVLASYAGFLWEAEEDDDEGDATQSEDYFAGAQVPFGALASAAHPRPLPC